ncbi:tetratricopeptide repeat protein [Halorussus salilacus]|nr:tetratricopeptide repeat protein [Halorussus salilacus]USZ66671.1 tetratricopeptide repeat protein [Halorussus salilacus]
MTDPEDHDFSEGDRFDDPYEAFDLDPPELDVDPDKVDPVDSRVVADLLDEGNVPADEVDVEELLDVGLNYMQINRFEQAADTFERVAQFAPDGSALEQEAWTNKGVAHAELEEWDEAIGAYREALHVDEDGEARRASNESGQRPRAGEHAATAETNLAYALWESGRSEQALEHAERAVEIDERFAEAWFNRGFFLLERGLAEDALNSIENAIRLGLRNSEVLDEKARALEELGQYDEAEEIAEEAEQMREQAEQELIESRRE